MRIRNAPMLVIVTLVAASSAPPVLAQQAGMMDCIIMTQQGNGISFQAPEPNDCFQVARRVTLEVIGKWTVSAISFRGTNRVVFWRCERKEVITQDGELKLNFDCDLVK